MQRWRCRCLVALVGTLALAVAGCGQRVFSRATSEDTAASPAAVGGALGGPAAAPAGGEKRAGISVEELAANRPDLYLIKNADVTIETPDVQKASARIVAATQAARGYVSNVHQSVDALGAHSVSMQVRVPYTQFDSSLQQIASFGKVLDRNVTTQDVTEDFVDTDARQRNLKQTEGRLLAHLGRSGKLSDTLLVEKELSRVREEIEQLEGHLRFLRNRVAFSTITVTLKESARPQALVPPESYSTGRTTSDAVRSLVGFAQGVWTVVIWVAVWLPVWGALALVAWWVARRRSARRARA